MKLTKGVRWFHLLTRSCITIISKNGYSLNASQPGYYYLICIEWLQINLTYIGNIIILYPTWRVPTTSSTSNIEVIKYTEVEKMTSTFLICSRCCPQNGQQYTIEGRYKSLLYAAICNRSIVRRVSAVFFTFEWIPSSIREIWINCVHI